VADFIATQRTRAIEIMLGEGGARPAGYKLATVFVVWWALFHFDLWRHFAETFLTLNYSTSFLKEAFL
jgi:hypothetical protein